MAELDKEIERKAIEKAQEKVDEVKTELEQQVEQKEENMDDLISEMAKLIIEENEQYLGTEVTTEAIKKVDEENTKEGGTANGKKTRKARKSE